MGIGISATLDDFAALCSAARWDSPPIEPVKALAEGWVEGGQTSDDCRDPLTGLVTPAYLRIRLGELYRAAADAELPPERSHRLLIVALDGAVDPWRRIARLIVIGHELRSFFLHGETVCLLSRNRVGVLAPQSKNPEERVAVLRRALVQEHRAELWSVPLPPTHPEAEQLVSDIAKPQL